MKLSPLILIIVVFCSCQKKEVKTTTPAKRNNNFYVGTYTNKEGKGIYKYELTELGKLKIIGLVATTKNPSFLTKSEDNKTLFAVNETNYNGTGSVTSYLIDKDTLNFISKSKTGGAHPCFIATNNENYILVANYSGGNVGLLKFDATGKLSELLNVQQHFGKGTTSRQEASHAHSAWFHPTKKEVISVDLGSNQLWFSTIDTEKDVLVLTEQKTLQMAEGAGPRHLTFHPNNKWIYVLNELNNTVSLVKESENKYFIDSSISTLPEDFTSFSKAADIHVSKDGKFLYASNRGHESIVIYEVNSENGTLKTVGFESVLGKNPRNFSLSPNDKFLLVANQDTDNIISFKRDAATGELTFVSEISAPTPVCILF
ncbi:6-phosphogluconolactonase [Polaribacter sp. SA4-10]|uniref:lactonase family protein n=1 Tax=Polaribacter sp. SA4-10 TaxID=754397 RepID=UPI000B3CEDE8|nr:lactonase family protein [Polaribacter sp. SA4-10]ARV07762.1 6-phosphogluconolactonase [Polaribacter sp. SA4-10]